MTLLVTNEGAQELLRRGLGYSATGDLKLRLFKNDMTPAKANTTASYTQADFTGYAEKTLTGTNWTVTNANPAAGSFAEQTFTSSAGSQNQPVYGYYVVNSAGTIVVFAERFTDGPYTITNNGDAIKVTPNFTGT
jgi:hypothetical protein